jgi:hypothetical protein
MRQQSHYNQPTDDVLAEINNLIALKRSGNFTEANKRYSKLYDREREDSHNAPYISKSWAKVLLCLGEYERAESMLRTASTMFKLNKNEAESWQCVEQAQTIRNRNSNPKEFIEYVRAASGGSLAYPINF